MADTAVDKLSKRLNQPQPAKKQPEAEQPPERKRHSLYFSVSAAAALDKAYDDAFYELRPYKPEKYALLEAIIEYGVDHIEEIKEILRQKANSEQGDK